MSTADRFAVEWFEPPLPGCTPWAVSIKPCAEEALASWLLRYVAPLGIPAEILLLDRTDAGLIERADWWRRPAPRLLAQLSARTGLAQPALAAMTFLNWPAQAWHEEIFERFARWRFQLPRSMSRCLHRFAICPQCLAEDQVPYVRKLWTLGWAGVCPLHTRVLLGKCPQCHQTLQLPLLSAYPLFAPQRCRRCGFHLSAAPLRPAHSLTVRLQERLLAHRHSATVPLPGLGTLQWPVAMAFFDILLGMVWNAPKSRSCDPLLARIRRDLDLTENPGEGHYEGLLILAWLLDQWPQRLRIALASLKAPHPRQQLQRASQLHPDMRGSIEKIFLPAWPDETHPVAREVWRGWIDTLAQSADQLRALAAKDQFRSRRVRLLALADLRDGVPVQAAARTAGVVPNTLYRWLKRGAEWGLEAALARRYDTLSPAQTLEIADWIATASPDEPRWRALRVQNEVLRRFGVQIKHRLVAHLLRTHGPWSHQPRVPSRRSTRCTLVVSRD
jgi:transposase